MEEEAREEAREEAERRLTEGPGDGDSHTVKSPSEYSCRSYEMWVGGERVANEDKEKMSLKSQFSLVDEGDPHAKSNGFRSRKASMSLPGSPFNVRRGSRGSHLNHNYKHGRKSVSGEKKPLVLSTYMDAQEHLPYADDSTAATPLSEENGTIIVPNYGAFSYVVYSQSFACVFILFKYNSRSWLSTFVLQLTWVKAFLYVTRRFDGAAVWHWPGISYNKGKST